MQISQAKGSDSPGIRKLEQQVWKDKVISSKYDSSYLIKFEYAFVAKEKNKIIGAILAMKTVKDEIYVEDIIISPKFQNHGIGKKLYETLLAHCGNVPVLASVTINNEALITLLKELGFKGVKKMQDPAVKEKSTSFLMRREKKAL